MAEAGPPELLLLLPSLLLLLSTLLLLLLLLLLLSLPLSLLPLEEAPLPEGAGGDLRPEAVFCFFKTFFGVPKERARVG